jgi:hypothetical protein
VYVYIYMYNIYIYISELVLGSRSVGFTSATFFSQSKMSQSSLNWDIWNTVQGWQCHIVFPKIVQNCSTWPELARKLCSIYNIWSYIDVHFIYVYYIMITCMHACKHTYVHTYTRTLVHTYTRTHVHTYTHTQMHACMHNIT